MSSDIVNLALRHIGSSIEVVDYLTERSQEARAAKAFYDIARDETLRDCSLPVTRRKIALAVVEENPDNRYLFSYRYPSDCVHLRNLLNPFSPQISVDNLLPMYEIGSDSTGSLIYSNITEAVALYIHRITDVTVLPSDFKMALSYKLAYYMIPSISGGDPFKRAPFCAQMYDLAVDKAKANAYNEEPGQTSPPSELVAAHGFVSEYDGFPISGRT